jgi:hypothetical protein
LWKINKINCKKRIGKMMCPDIFRISLTWNKIDFFVLGNEPVKIRFKLFQKLMVVFGIIFWMSWFLFYIINWDFI